ncbi:MAG: hypothetical protein LBF28_03545 [Rickettsiales bacterium]|jgi:hypothetical protein|nr:hypothetical protein [Rickettsiales bacterium]
MLVIAANVPVLPIMAIHIALITTAVPATGVPLAIKLFMFATYQDAMMNYALQLTLTINGMMLPRSVFFARTHAVAGNVLGNGGMREQARSDCIPEA